MELLADLLLLFGALGAAFYCYVLSRRLTRFTDLEQGVGGAVAVLSVQVDEMTKALEAAQRTAADSLKRIEATTRRAEEAASRLELLLASMHDVPEPASQRAARVVRRPRRHGQDDSEEQAA